MKQIFNIVILLLILTTSEHTHSQQLFTSYINNLLVVNPAYAGIKRNLNAQLVHRNQWVGFDNAPQTTVLSAHTPIPFYHNSAVGLSIMNDRLGSISQTAFFMDYSHTLKFRKGQLAMGIKGGLGLFSDNLTGLHTNNKNDPYFNSNIHGTSLVNFGVGLFYYTETIFIGVSAPRMLLNSIEVEDVAYDYNERIYYLSGGGIWRLKRHIKIRPSALLQVWNDATPLLDFSTYLIFNDKLWLGLGGRNIKAIMASAQLQINSQLKIGYSFDYNFVDSNLLSLGTHEISIIFRYQSKRDKHRIHLPYCYF